MGLKKYIFGALALIIGISGYVFTLEHGEYTVTIAEKSLVLPIAAWVVVPAVILFVFSIAHMMFYGMKNYLKLKAVDKDYEAMITFISKKLLNEEPNVTFKNEKFKDLGKIMDQLNLTLAKDHFTSTSKVLNTTTEQLINIKGGTYVPAKELKLANDNPIMIENLKNRIETDENFCLDVIKKDSGYPFELVKKAFLKALETKSMTTIKKYIDDMQFDADMLIALFKKDSEQQKEFALTNETIFKLIKNSDLTNDQLIQIATQYKKSMSPDQIINLFEDIASLDEDYTPAYLYVLTEYEMIDKIRDILSASSSNEYTSYKALLDLRDSGKHTYSLSSLCYK